ncbi:MAG: SRPBCC family protein [Pseudomonadales bacterium]|jgi:uncharacterized protein YndB with AHSA1/START domain|nr:SRPBCC family protein [Pseudomonadales bacterium]
MWNHEEVIETSAPAARVWELFADVARWKSWNAGIETCEIHGPFKTGTPLTMTPPGQNALHSTLIEVIPGQSFTDETVVDETRVVVYHQLISLPSGNTRIIYRTEITGPAAAELGPMVASDFADVLASLKNLAESS